MKIVYFSAPWCMPCKQLKPKVVKLAKESGLEIEEVNIDKHPEVAAGYGIKGVPRIFVEASGEMVDPTSMPWRTVQEKIKYGLPAFG